METLILTGWRWHDYACAAAVALRKYPDADAKGMSMGRLLSCLKDILEEEKSYEQIIILGIGWRGDPDDIINTLKKLQEKDIKVVWISCLPLGKWLPEEINECLSIQLYTQTDCLTEAVADFYKQEYKDLLPIVENNTKNETALAWKMLFDTAMFYYRSYQNPDIYSGAVRMVARGNNVFTDRQKEMIDHYKKFGNREIKGSSPAIEKLRETINKVAPKDRGRVLIQGESGTGKETVAVQLHYKSPRAREPMICFNCATLSTQLLEDGWFGHSKGAFTGASKERKGVFLEADGGTLFLDEIGELTLEAQGALLRVLQEGRFQRLGDLKEFEIDVRVITATNRNLAQMVKDGKFREDLFHRLCVIPIHMLPLREHLEDIKEIANSFWLKLHKQRLSPEQTAVLETYHWPGNVRELHNFLERADILEESDFAKLLKEHIAMTNPDSKQPDQEVESLEELTRRHAARMLEKYESNISKAAEAMGISRNTLKKYIK
jgi:DNA-binding NtrC family response regulator